MGQCARTFKGHDCVGISMQDQRRNTDPLQIVTEIRIAERAHTTERSDLIRLQTHCDRCLTLSLVDLHLTVGRKEIAGEIVEIHAAIGFQSGLFFFRFFGRQRTVGIVRSVHQTRRHRGREHDPAQSILPVQTDITRHFASTHRESDQHRIMQIQIDDQPRQVVCQRVVVVAMIRLLGTTEAAAVVGDDPKTCIAQRWNLRCPRLAGQRPTVDQNDGTPIAAGILHMELSPPGPLYA